MLILRFALYCINRLKHTVFDSSEWWLKSSDDNSRADTSHCLSFNVALLPPLVCFTTEHCKMWKSYCCSLAWLGIVSNEWGTLSLIPVVESVWPQNERLSSNVAATTDFGKSLAPSARYYWRPREGLPSYSWNYSKELNPQIKDISYVHILPDYAQRVPSPLWYG